MKNKILYWLYKRFAAKFQDFMVREYLEEVPDQVYADAITVFSSQKKKLQKLNNYLAYSLHNRMRQDPKNSERYQGMFVQLKMFHSILDSRPDPKKPYEERAAEDPKKKEQQQRYDQALQTAAQFSTGELQKTESPQ